MKTDIEIILSNTRKASLNTHTTTTEKISEIMTNTMNLSGIVSDLITHHQRTPLLHESIDHATD